MGRLHVTPTTVASNATAKPPMPPRIKMPRRSKLLNGTASALDLPRFANELLPDVALELVEIEGRRGHPDAHVGVSVTLQQYVARVLDFGSVMKERSALVVAPADELL